MHMCTWTKFNWLTMANKKVCSWMQCTLMTMVKKKNNLQCDWKCWHINDVNSNVNVNVGMTMTLTKRKINNNHTVASLKWQWHNVSIGIRSFFTTTTTNFVGKIKKVNACVSIFLFFLFLSLDSSPLCHALCFYLHLFDCWVHFDTFTWTRSCHDVMIFFHFFFHDAFDFFLGLNHR